VEGIYRVTGSLAAQSEALAVIENAQGQQLVSQTLIANYT
jgi:hypothetical protein